MTRKTLLMILCISCAVPLLASCNQPAVKTAAPHIAAPLPKEAVAKEEKNGLDSEIYQISHSNLPPDKKQRLLDQIRATGGVK